MTKCQISVAPEASFMRRHGEIQTYCDAIVVNSIISVRLSTELPVYAVTNFIEIHNNS